MNIYINTFYKHFEEIKKKLINKKKRKKRI